MILWILITSSGQHKYLRKTLESIQQATLPPETMLKVVVSSYDYPDKLVDLAKDFLEVTFFQSRVKLFQFDHYRLLAGKLPIDDTDMVMLCDDDDVIFPDAFEIITNPLSYDPEPTDWRQVSFVGQQILVDVDENLDQLIDLFVTKPQQLRPAINEADPSRHVDDLSGTTTSGRNFKTYFKHRPDVFRPMEDIAYMDMIEKLDNWVQLKYPIVGHRLKTESSGWQQDLAELNQQLKNL